MKNQLIPFASTTDFDRARGEFNNGMRQNAHGYAPWRDVRDSFAYDVLPVEIDQIEGELHKEGMNALARCDPEPFSDTQMGVFQQSGSALRAGVSHIDGVPEQSPTRKVLEPVFHFSKSLNQSHTLSDETGQKAGGIVLNARTAGKGNLVRDNCRTVVCEVGAI